MSRAFSDYIKMGHTSISNYLLRRFTELGMTTEEFVVYLELKSFLDRGNKFPDIKSVASNSGITEQHCYQLLHQLVKKKLMKIISSPNGDRYDFSLLEAKTIEQLEREEDKYVKNGRKTTYSSNIDTNNNMIRNNNTAKRRQLFKDLQQEFGRTLSGIEMESVNDWLEVDHYDIDVIRLALKEAVLSQVYNLKYMDRILYQWKQRNLFTAADIEDDRKKKRATYGRAKVHDDKGPEIPFFKIE